MVSPIPDTTLFDVCLRIVVTLNYPHKGMVGQWEELELFNTNKIPGQHMSVPVLFSCYSSSVAFVKLCCVQFTEGKEPNPNVANRDELVQIETVVSDFKKLDNGHIDQPISVVTIDDR